MSDAYEVNAAQQAYGSAGASPYSLKNVQVAQAQEGYRPPPPDGGPGWKWNASTGQWEMDPGQQSAHDQWQAAQGLQAKADQVAAGAPTVQAATSQLAPQGSIADNRVAQENGTAGGMPVPTVDPSQIADARASRDAALADQRKVLASTLNLQIDPVEQQALQQRYFERGLANANTLAANARGGAGAVAAARQQAINQTPAIMGQASDQARAEELAQFNARIQQSQTAGGIANTIGQTATQSFGQESQLAQGTAQIGLGAIQAIQADTGMKINADLAQQQMLGNMIQDVMGLGVQYAGLDLKAQQDIFDQIAESHHIDQQTAGQIKAIAAQKKKGVMDYIMGGLGAAEGVANTAAKFGAK